MESDLIKRSELRETLEMRNMTELYPEWRTLSLGMKEKIRRLAEAYRRAIDSAPAVDAVPVVHARWIYSGDMDSDGNSQGYCSRCGAGDKHRADLKNLVPYCLKCGARMDAEEDTNGHQND